MKKLEPLAPEALYRRCDPGQFSFTTTAELADHMEIIGQDRAVQAVRFGVGIKREGYNLFALGPTGLGKHTFIRRFLESQAAAEPLPADWCYVNDFGEPHRPKALRLPAGGGARFREDMAQLVEELRVAIPAAFDSDEYRLRAERLDADFNERQEKALKELGEEASRHDIALLHTPTGFSFAPMKKGEVLGSEEYGKLPKEQQDKMVQLVAALEAKLEKILRKIPRWRKERREKHKALNREVGMAAVAHLIDEVKEAYAGEPEVLAYLDGVNQDVVDNVDDFRKSQERPAALFGPPQEETDSLRRYRVNLLVDHGNSKGAPVVFEDNPTYQNLVGRVEHMSQLGTLVTDFTLIKPGALHRANGGYLLIDVYKLLSQPFAWEGLKRALNSRKISIESLGQAYSLISTVSLEPEPIPLDLKVILFGDRLYYYLLHHYDPEFQELFKVAADFEEQVDRSAGNDLLYARLIGTLARQEGLLPLDREAVARVIEQTARSVGDAEKVSTHMESLTDLLREADHWAREAGRGAVDRHAVERAIAQQIRRADRVRDRMHEAILRGTVLIDTEGARVGQVNGLSVLELGNFAFAQPTRITATTRLGDGNVVDIEREVNLGGAIHSKGVLILSAFFAARYAKNRPLSLSGSLVFEQTYGGVEGDSASLAELCALLSSLSAVPLKQSLAITGSVNQQGEVQAIGGVNEKIEGFYDICRARGLNGGQGVLIPGSNIKHLMLRADVVEAVRQGKFQVYPVRTVDEAIELLTGAAAGEPDAAGHYPAGSINQRVSARIASLSEMKQKYAGLARARNKGKEPKSR
ncbi:MAG: AAA family ATPase [Betaproteobacteria bacterium]|nr:AAA family ATPase [Betaproteobacteria bacterium]